MFDYHMHSKVSFDGQSHALDMALAAKERGLKEICFTDHIDREINVEKEIMVFDQQVYNATYENLEDCAIKDIFTDIWLQHLSKDIHWIYSTTQNEQAEKYLLADFADKLLKIKEKIDVKLR